MCFEVSWISRSSFRVKICEWRAFYYFNCCLLNTYLSAVVFFVAPSLVGSCKSANALLLLCSFFEKLPDSRALASSTKHTSIGQMSGRDVCESNLCRVTGKRTNGRTLRSFESARAKQLRVVELAKRVASGLAGEGGAVVVGDHRPKVRSVHKYVTSSLSRLFNNTFFLFFFPARRYRCATWSTPERCGSSTFSRPTFFLQRTSSSGLQRTQFKLPAT